MKYLEKIKETNEALQERFALVSGRVAEIAEKPEIAAPYADYFATVAKYLLAQKEIVAFAQKGEMAGILLEKGEAFNAAMFGAFKPENYETCYANPAYASRTLGEDYGVLLASLYHSIFANVRFAYEGNICCLCIYSELLVELYNCFENPEELSKAQIEGVFYSFHHDYEQEFAESFLARCLFDADYDYFEDIVMHGDLTTPEYLYRYGYYIEENAIKSSAYLNTFSDEQIQAMADTFTEGYRIGFITCNKDITKKDKVDVRYPIGFERMARAAVQNFAKLGLTAILRPYPVSVNKQFDYDWKEKDALWLDKGMVEYRIECYRNALESFKEVAPGYGGPAVIEIFGEVPFSPQAKEANPAYSEKQQKLYVHWMGAFQQMINEYIHGEERSFTIIAYPVPAIGEDFEAIFAETVKLNTLDYNLYQGMQQKIIDVLDTADCVHIVGANGNRTDLYIKICELADPDKETAFENCVADVNIPVGEVFTSPVLEGTHGKLHVSQVYLNELNYLNLEMDFEDGKITSYTCTNFEDEEENRKYLSDNVLFHHPTLPIGEFAIGTNTTAYRMARVFDIADKMPILIAEKTGPHFAVGDTCYRYDEDNTTYNPDGKAIVARENSISALRKEDPSKAYFNCHTDITIPYDELGAITVIRKDGSTQDIIRDGRFVVPGTEILNEPLDDLARQNQ